MCKALVFFSQWFSHVCAWMHTSLMFHTRKWWESNVAALWEQISTGGGYAKLKKHHSYWVHIQLWKNKQKSSKWKKHIARLAPFQSTRKCKWQSAKPETHEMKQHPQAKKGQFHPNACLHYQDSYSSTVWTLYTFIKPSGMLSLVFQVDCLNLTLMTSPQDLELV